MKRMVVVLLCALTFWLPSSVGAADLQEIVHETQRIRQEGGIFDLVWWIPTEYWTVVLEKSPQLTEEQRKAFLKVLDPYVILAVGHMKTGIMGGMTASPREEILKNLQLRVNNRVLPPLSMEELSPDASNFVLMMKPMLAKILGAIGKGLEFVVFPNVEKGHKIVDPLRPGTMECVFYGTAYHWRLPLGSLLPPMRDRESGETFPGNYIYNPFTGKKLERVPEAQKTVPEPPEAKRPQDTASGTTGDSEASSAPEAPSPTPTPSTSGGSAE